MGSLYAPSMAARVDDGTLRAIIEEMVVGPAQSSLPRPALTALTEFHVALARGGPFAVWTARRGAVLQGEAGPDTEIEAVAGAAPVSVARDGPRWSFELPAGSSVGAVRVTARRNGVEAVFDLGSGALTVLSESGAIDRSP